MPGVPPTGKKLSIPLVAIVNVRGDRLYHGTLSFYVGAKILESTFNDIEHIWWDQATALRQAGILPTHVPYPGPKGSSSTLRLPVAGVECAHLLLDETKGKSNEMMGVGWGIQEE